MIAIVPDEVVTPNMSPKQLIKATRKEHLKARKKDIAKADDCSPMLSEHQAAISAAKASPPSMGLKPGRVAPEF
ncbi:MAG: hypothetical protein EOQ39_13155 [Mesorhizobium sp.]|uniref:hypothetical protein n=1 Tax=Mesorhizobium sp. TaxID=1871066 RepID=UPI000FEA4415|nr:hypothetical protein [Mesorhizobium sp.]RWB09938.1 MAG: hypothetical protein EOQ37_01875 [Mesorhizobium sp.]RWB15344.1 MAG: hypothetical protein EOQ39_13155 [Mesorhizobium sp.]RWO74332.1 MAG: hypothetical protein EOS17_00575 [Mesorhizobium sp.]